MLYNKYSYTLIQSNENIFRIYNTILQARRKVTQKTSMDEITEQTGTTVISRGSFIPPGKK